MKYIVQKISVYVLILIVFSFWVTGPALGVILHPDGDVDWNDLSEFAYYWLYD